MSLLWYVAQSRLLSPCSQRAAAIANLSQQGRSPYEPLDVEHLDLTTHPFSAVSDRLTAYGHVQCYDLHGYPTNLLSKRYAEQLRRSQSDILDAMGFVVTSAGVRASKSRQRRKQLLITENDCGLAFALFNETLMGFSVWWSQSLRRRLQVHTPPVTLIAIQLSY